MSVQQTLIQPIPITWIFSYTQKTNVNNYLLNMENLNLPNIFWYGTCQHTLQYYFQCTCISLASSSVYTSGSQSWLYCPMRGGGITYGVVGALGVGPSECTVQLSTTGDFRLDTGKLVSLHQAIHTHIWARCSVVHKAACYEPAGSGFESHNPPFRTRPWGLLNL
jgi:hypothetical protein